MAQCLFCGEETNGNLYCNKKCSSKFQDLQRSNRRKMARELAQNNVICEICLKKIDDPKPRQKTHVGDCRKESISRYRKLRHKKAQDAKPTYRRICRCGREFTTRNRIKTMCREPECLAAYILEKSNNNYEKNSARQKEYYQARKEAQDIADEDESQTMTVICPGCKRSREHTFYPAWAGNPNITPRIRCDDYPGCIGNEHGNQSYDRTPDMVWEMLNRASL